MESNFVTVSFDIYCHWQGIPPIYRIYVSDELFSERTWIWTENYLTEILQIKAPPGKYSVRLESVGPNLAEFRVTNFAIKHGPARWLDLQTLEVFCEST